MSFSEKDRKNLVNKSDSVPSEKQCKYSDGYLIAKQTLINHSSFSSRERCYGACLDTGAQTTVIGLKQGKTYCNFTGTNLNNKSINKQGLSTNTPNNSLKYQSRPFMRLPYRLTQFKHNDPE